MSPRKRPAEPSVARSIYLPPRLNEQLTAEAEATGLSGNAIIILALRQYLAARAMSPAPPASPAPAGDIADFGEDE